MKKIFMGLVLVLLVGSVFADFTSTGDYIDEVFYWGKIDGKIKISKENIEQFLNSEVDK